MTRSEKEQFQEAQRGGENNVIYQIFEQLKREVGNSYKYGQGNYIKSGSGYYPTCDGHCVAGNRVKGRKTKDMCKAFAQKVYGRNMI